MVPISVSPTRTDLHRVHTTRLCVVGVFATTVRTVGAFGLEVAMPISLAAVAVQIYKSCEKDTSRKLFCDNSLILST